MYSENDTRHFFQLLRSGLKPGLRSGCHRENLSTGMGRHLPHGGPVREYAR